MELIKWADEFNTNIEEIDNQHKQLVQLINSLGISIKSNVQKNTIEDILFELIKYTIIHFSYEEELMSNIKYIDLEEHSAQHKKFENLISDFNAKYLGNEISISNDLFDFLKFWLLNHISISDKKMANSILFSNY